MESRVLGEWTGLDALIARVLLGMFLYLSRSLLMEDEFSSYDRINTRMEVAALHELARCGLPACRQIMPGKFAMLCC